MMWTALQSWLKGHEGQQGGCGQRPVRQRARRNPVRPGGMNDWLLEDRCLLSGVPNPVPVPSGSTTAIGQVMWIGGDPLNTDGGIKNLPNPPMKTVTITNTSSTQWIYPFLRDANTGSAGAAFYDPQDFHNQEYRIYVGYVKNGQNYLGLPPNSSITFQVPVVFWNAENTYVATEGTNLIPTQTGQVNPFTYDTTSQRGVSVSTQSNSWVTSFTNTDKSLTAGLIMFYHVPGKLASTPALAAPAQLAEFTIRDPYLKRFGITSKADTNVIIDYDVSYVDNAIAPISVEATAVPIQVPTAADKNLAANPPAPPFGWTGANMTFDQMQAIIQDFINNTPNSPAYVGQYFTNPLSPSPSPAPGWPAYNNPQDPTDLVKIPAGQNVFLQSPLNGAKSDLNNNYFMLTSGGTAEITQLASSLMPVTQPNPTQLLLSGPTDAAARATFVSNMQAILKSGTVDFLYSNTKVSNQLVGTLTGYNPTATIQAINVTNGGSGYSASKLPTVLVNGKSGIAEVFPGFIQNGKITAIALLDTKTTFTTPPTVTIVSGGNTGIPGSGATASAIIGGGMATVKYNNGFSLPTGDNLTYIFQRPASDYAATDITNLWYSWAQYYINYIKQQYPNLPSTGVSGTLTVTGTVKDQNQAALLTLDKAPVKPYSVGMTVDGPGITPAAGTKVTIVKVLSPTQYSLSQLPQTSGPFKGNFTFGAPPALPYSDPTGIKSITVTNGGSGYVPAPTVTISGGDGAGATAVINGITNGQITSIQLTSKGGNYGSAPKVTIGGGGGTGATATAVITNGQVTSITINNKGSGYFFGPTVSITGGGTGATAIAVVDPNSGSITGISITNAGTKYSSNSPPTVTITGGKGSGAKATATVGTYVSVYPQLLPPATPGSNQVLFAGSVYEALQAEASIPPSESLRFYQPVMPPPVGLVGTTIGSDLGDLPNSNGGASELGGQIRDLIKSVLRGVWDFNVVTTGWYPDPSQKTGSVKFNPYNLDPYVWFIHSSLGLSGYGFSTDDDIANVGAFTSPYADPNSKAASLPNNVAMEFGGVSGLPQQQQWYPGVPWGKVQTTGKVSTSGGNSYVTLTPGQVTQFFQVIPVTPGQLGSAYVIGQGIPLGTTMKEQGVANNLQFILNVPNGQKVTPSGDKTISLTFQGFLPSPNASPPPVTSPAPVTSPPPVSSTPSAIQVSSTPSAIQELVQLAQDEFLMTIDQVFVLADLALGTVPDPALAASIAAYQNALNANPLEDSLIGQAVISFVQSEALRFLMELSILFGPVPV